MTEEFSPFVSDPDDAVSARLTSHGLERMLTTEDVARFIGVSVDTLYAWRSVGTGPRAHRFGKHLRFTRDDLLVFVASRREA